MDFHYHPVMVTIHMSEAEAARDFTGVLARVRAGAEIIIENKNSGRGDTVEARSTYLNR